jgi:hypothetical protein
MPLCKPRNGKRNPRAIVLDRDGVVNEKMSEGQYVFAEPIPVCPEVIAQRNRAGTRRAVSNRRRITVPLTCRTPTCDCKIVSAW